LQGPSTDGEDLVVASSHPKQSHAIEAGGTAIGASMPLEPRGPPIDAVVLDVARLMNFFDEKFNSVCHPPSPIPVEFHLEEHHVDEQQADDEPAAEKDSALALLPKPNSTGVHNDVGHKVCHVCGGTPCEWEQYGLTIITLMMHAFDHQNRSPNGLLLDPCTNQAVDNRTARRLAYKMYQYEKFGTINSSKSLPVSCCVVRQIKSLYP